VSGNHFVSISICKANMVLHELTVRTRVYQRLLISVLRLAAHVHV